jgi:hypothetical protein
LKGGQWWKKKISRFSVMDHAFPIGIVLEHSGEWVVRDKSPKPPDWFPCRVR